MSLVTQRQLHRALAEIYERLDSMPTQADIDQITTSVNQVASDLASTKSTLQAEIDQLAQANPTLDLTALQTAVAPLDNAVKDLAAIKPTPAAPAA